MSTVLFNFLMPTKTKDLLDQVARNRSVTKSSILNNLAYNFVKDEIQRIKEDELLFQKFSRKPSVRPTGKSKQPRSTVNGYIENDEGTWVLASEHEDEDTF
jgi:hypothetical protein